MSGAARRRAAPSEPEARLDVAVVPRAARDEVAGCDGGTVRIRLTAPPVENRANEALVRFLAGLLGLPRSRIRIAAGGSGRRKLVAVGGICRSEVYARLGLPAPPGDPSASTAAPRRGRRAGPG